MGWNDEALAQAAVFYSVWLASGIALVILVRVGHSSAAEVLAWTCVALQLLAAARGVQVNFAPLTVVSLVFAACGALALRRLRSVS